MKIPPIPLKKPRRGFALVVTMSLMALLLVLSVGLLSLSSVSLRTSAAGNADRIAQANARLGLLMAIGELQKYAGKDQRITATADIAGDPTGERLGDGGSPANDNSLNGVSKGLTGVQAGTRRWTGVWENSLLQSGSGGDPGTEIFTNTPSPVLVQWLVSGNESGSGPKYTPASQEMSVGSDGKAANSDEAVVLVGEHSVGSPGSDTLPNYVVAPLVTIKGENANGKYAYWVGDEGVKARLNTTSSYRSGDLATSANMSAQRRAWETVEDFNGYPIPGSDTKLKGVLTVGQIGLFDKGLTSGAPSPMNEVFHAATTDSYGVLSDTLNGGLRLDLSTLLENLPSSPIAGVANAPATNNKIIPEAFSPKIGGPKWDRLKDFKELRQKASGDSIDVQTLSGGAVIAPVITDLRLVLGASISRAASASYFVNALGKVAITIANPYPYTLRWTSPLRLKFSYSDPSRSYAHAEIRGNNIRGNVSYVSARSTSEPSVLSNTQFDIPAGSLPAGEARCFTNGGRTLKPNNAVITVVLQEATGANLANLDASVVLRNITPSTPNLQLTVLEGENTAPVDVQLTTGGAANTLLRKLNRIDLDSALYLGARQHDVFVDATTLARTGPGQVVDRPFALQTFSIQLSQPGFPERTNFSDPGYFGIRSSTMRTFADFNLQGINYRKSIISYNPAPYFMTIAPKASYTIEPPNAPPSGLNYYPSPSDFTANLNEPKWGRTQKSSSPNKTILFGMPETLSSIAQFQHADLTGDDEFASVGHQPGNAVGNSYATPYVQRRLTKQLRADYKIQGEASALSENVNYYDIAYLLNASLWDTYFFSTVSQAGRLLNEQMIDINPTASSSELKDGQTAASRLMVEGAFNINSTEKNAWKALLGSSKYLRHQADSAGQQSEAFFPRSLEQTTSSTNPPTGVQDDSFSGYRRLSDAQLDTLAGEITKQVRLRGPFVSLSHFVNRALAPITANRELTRSGALQSAIDNSVSGTSAININPAGTVSGFRSLTGTELTDDRVTLRNFNATAGMADFPGNKSTNLGAIWPTMSSEKNPGSVASILADIEMMTNPSYRTEQGSRSTGIPGWLTQADVLQVIGPAITARSDTFKIRAYGEATDAQGKVIAKAWCEAIVQRTPSYVDPSDVVTERNSATSKQLSEINDKFGRQIKMISFRWLSPYEI